jgi:hypothetical protein
MTTVMVTFCYSSGLPILYLISFFFMFFIYYFDKFYVLLFCRKPNKINGELHDFMVSILKFIPLIHCLFAVHVFGTPSIFLGDSQ